MVTIGQRAESLNFGWMEALTEPLGTERGGKVTVVFDNTGNIREGVSALSFLSGNVRDGGVLLEINHGDIFKSTNDGLFEVVAYHETRNIDIKFLNTGNIKRGVQKDAMLSGYVTDELLRESLAQAKADILKAEQEVRAALLAQRQRERDAENLIKFQKLEAVRAKRVETLQRKISFQEKAVAREADNKLYTETVLIPKEVDNNLAKPRKGVLELDFKDRSGNWVLRFQMNDEFIQTRLGKLHNNVSQRCKIGGSFQAMHSGTYKGVTLSDDWKDPQKFCDWCVQQPGWGLGYSLEKDLLIPGNKQYCAEACVFLPQAINSAIVFTAKNNAGTVFSNTKGHYAKVSISGKHVRLPYRESYQEALTDYISYKEGYVHRLAYEFKNSIDDRAYQALINLKF